jgi:hypothetical protein
VIVCDKNVRGGYVVRFPMERNETARWRKLA